MSKIKDKHIFQEDFKMNRKLIAIFTALLLAASLCACNTGGAGEETTDDNRIEIPTGDEGTSANNGGDTTEDTTAEVTVSVEDFEEIDDTVYILVLNKAVNLRKSPSMSDSAIALSVSNGTELKRTGVNGDGWSRVTYKDETYYVKTSCVISNTDLDGFVAASGTVTVSGNFNVRIAPSSSNDLVGNYAKGDSFEVIAVNQTTGWYKVNFTGLYYTGEAYVAIIPKYMKGNVVIEGAEDTTAEETTTEETTVLAQ